TRCRASCRAAAPEPRSARSRKRRARARALSSGRSSEAHSLEPESEQHVAGTADQTDVTRAHVEHAVDDGSTVAVHRAAVRLDAVDGLEAAIRVVTPDHHAARARIRANAAVHRAQDHGARDGRGCRALARAAAALAAAEP